MTATCRNSDCPDVGIGKDIGDQPVDEDGQPMPGWTVWCGLCGQPITDVTE
ncbi:MAG: hypothetical protein J2P16_14280 [Mycobacterium sp.]|nr:hypothetical protein [Mycobacterium sp.]